MTFEENKQLFQDELEVIMGKYGIEIYPANVVMPSGEVMPMIKMAEAKKEEDLMIKDVKNEDQSKG